MLTNILIAVILVAIAMTLLCVKVLIRKNGRFSSQHIHDNQALKEKGIHCVIEQDREMREQENAVKEHR
ncbi:MAG: hypothetical protein IKX22_01855 [Prevotella sp.]|nr:hypothetical protein [Prevotella sp.]